MNPSSRRALRAALAVATLAACKSGDRSGPGCHGNDECSAQHAGNQRWYCDTSQTPPACAVTPMQCGSAADCCPGQICNAEGHFCADKYTQCSDASACPAPGQVCRTIGEFPSGPGCTYEACGADGSCTAAGTSCFNGWCVAGAPCGQGCSAGKVCVTRTNLCSPAPADASCQASCPAGRMLVLADGNDIFDSCHAPETCACATLPPLATRDVSRHSSLAAAGDELYVSAYDGEHGDLVVHTFDRSDPSRPKRSEWLDGVPASGHIGGDVAGPRGGIVDAGPNVGMYSSIAASAQGDLYVAYYDVDNGNLKFTARYAGRWIAPITIDGDGERGDVGLYASIALDPSGIPAVAYFRRGSWDAASASETGPSTGLLYAVAKTTRPVSASDWAIVEVDSAQRPATTALRELPPGTGLMPSLAFLDSHPVVAYYDSLNHSVKAVLGSGSGTAPAFAAPVEIDGNDGGPRRDTGRWPALAIGPSTSRGRIAIAFGDRTSRQLLLYQSSGLSAHAAGLIHVVDDGRPDPNGAWHPQTMPGAQVAISFTPSGKIALAYQDAMPVDLIYAVWDPLTATRVSRTVLRNVGATGFWPRLLVSGGQAFVSSAAIKAATPHIAWNPLSIDVAPAP